LIATLEPALAAAALPALVLWGEHDTCLDAEAVGRPLATALRAQLQILPSGHFLPLERADLVARALVEFLAALPASQG